MFVVDSLPYVYSKGIDTDFLYRPTRDLNVQGGLTIANTRFSHSDYGALLSSGYLGTPPALRAPVLRLDRGHLYLSSAAKPLRPPEPRREVQLQL